MKIETGGPAFPTIPYATGTGMTLLDFFASQAMIALRPHHDFPPHVIAEVSYRIAQAMLTEKKRLEVESKGLPKVG